MILAILSAGIQQPRELKILLDDYCNNQGFEMDLATDDIKVGGALRTLEWRKKTQVISLFQSCVNMRHADYIVGDAWWIDLLGDSYNTYLKEFFFIIGGCRVVRSYIYILISYLLQIIIII